MALSDRDRTSVVLAQVAGLPDAEQRRLAKIVLLSLRLRRKLAATGRPAAVRS